MLSIEVEFDGGFFGSYVDLENPDNNLSKIFIINLNLTEVLNAAIYVKIILQNEE